MAAIIPADDGKGAGLFSVRLSAPTPLQFAQTEIAANSFQDAWNKFCAMNGISDSDAPLSIVRIL